MYIANIYSWDRFDNELQMLVIIFDDWRFGVMVPSPPKALKILTPESTRKHGELTLAYKPKQFFLLFQQKKKERERKAWLPLRVIWVSSSDVRGRWQMAAAPGEVLFQPGARCQATPPLFRGTPVISRLNRVISQQSTNVPDNRPRFLALICRAAAGRRRRKKKEAGGSARGLSQMELGLRPTFCHCTSTTVAPGYK